MQGIDQRAAVGLSGLFDNGKSIVKRGNRSPAHVFKIDAHVEIGSQIAEFGKIGDEPGAIRIITANAENVRLRLSRAASRIGVIEPGRKSAERVTNSMS